jgi:hypothetical protein
MNARCFVNFFMNNLKLWIAFLCDHVYLDETKDSKPKKPKNHKGVLSNRKSANVPDWV